MKRKLFMTRIYAARISLLRPPDHSNGLRLIRSSRDGAATASVSSEIHDNARQNFPPLCFSLGKAAAVRNAIEGDTRDSTTSDNSAQSSLYKKPNHVRFEGFIMNNNFSVFSSSPHRSLACALTWLIFYLLLFYFIFFRGVLIPHSSLSRFNFSCLAKKFQFRKQRADFNTKVFTKNLSLNLLFEN